MNKTIIAIALLIAAAVIGACWFIFRDVNTTEIRVPRGSYMLGRDGIYVRCSPGTEIVAVGSKVALTFGIQGLTDESLRDKRIGMQFLKNGKQDAVAFIDCKPSDYNLKIFKFTKRFTLKAPGEWVVRVGLIDANNEWWVRDEKHYTAR